MLFELALAASTMAMPDGNRLRPLTQCFVQEMDGKPVGVAFQRVEPAVAAGRPAWAVVVHQHVGDRFDMRDAFVLARADLRPISLVNSRFGKPHVTLAYEEGRVTGTRVDKDGSSAAIDVALAHPVWDGNLWGVVLGALPMRAGASFELPFYQYDKGLGSFRLTVTGEERIDTPAGRVAAWRAELKPDDKTVVTYWFDRLTGAELGYKAGRFSTRLGGDCTGVS